MTAQPESTLPLTIRQFSDAYIRLLRVASGTRCGDIGGDALAGIDATGLDRFDLEALRRYLHTLGTLLSSLDKKQQPALDGRAVATVNRGINLGNNVVVNIEQDLERSGA